MKLGWNDSILSNFGYTTVQFLLHCSGKENALQCNEKRTTS